MKSGLKGALLRTITVGHTPDMDDAFMFHAIAAGAIPLDDFRFAHVIEDIQSLNRRALDAELDMTAISAASYPAVAQKYWIVAVGSSVGQDYGPLVIAAKPLEPQQLVGLRIAVPGLATTAYFLLRLAVPEFSPIEMRFEEIPQAVQAGSVDAGLVIHEWQLTYGDAGLVPALDLGRWWQHETHLPIPLGLNVVKKSLGRSTATAVATALRDSILYAFAHEDEAMAYAMRYGRGTDPERSRTFVRMYVNEDSLTLSRHCREALKILFKRARAAGLINSVPRLSVIEPAK